MNTFQDAYKPVVLIFTSPGAFPVSLIEKLLLNQCRVVIATSQLEIFRRLLSHVPDKNLLEIINLSPETLENYKPNYVVFVSDGLEPEDSVENTNALSSKLSFIKQYSTSTLFILPYSIFQESLKEDVDRVKRFVEQNREICKVVFLGDLIGPGINFSEKTPIAKILKDISVSTRVSIPKQNFSVFPIGVGDAAQRAVRLLFSFAGLGEMRAIIGKSFEVEGFEKLLKNINPSFDVVRENPISPINKPQTLTRTEVVDSYFGEVFKQSVFWYTPRVDSRLSNTQSFLTKQSEETKSSQTKKSKPRNHFLQKKRLIMFLILMVFFLITPYFLVFAGCVSLVVTKNYIFSGNFAAAGKINSLTKSLFNVADFEVDMFLVVPLINNFYEPASEMSKIGASLSLVISKSLVIADTSQKLANKVLTGNGDNISSYSNKMVLDLDNIYFDLSFLEGDLEKSKGVAAYFSDNFLKKLSLKEIRDKVNYLRGFFKAAPEILGEKGKKTYLVLMQNNMELRPSGGFIGSFALVSFDKGKLENVDVLDVYDADGQLKGHVEPPEAIAKYLGEAGWYLRDSNWDPDFAVNAQRAEWFLDKEIEANIDGVVGLDLSVVKDLVAIFGQLNLPDFNQVITADNLYQVTQDQVEENFFPGSRKKANFLTGLSGALLDKVTNIKSQEYFGVAKIVLNNLDKRHIQLYLEDSNAQVAANSLGWDGVLNMPKCQTNCYDDYTGIVEANLGVNKANYYVSRKFSLDTVLDKNFIYQNLIVDITNSASVKNDATIYKTYLRLLIPQNATLQTVEVINAGKTIQLVPDEIHVRDRKEEGVWLEIPAQSSTRVVFKWQAESGLDYTSSGHYSLNFRKQAGTEADPFMLTLGAALTNQRQRSYNTTLDRDFRVRIDW